MTKIKATLIGPKISSNSKSAFELFASQRWGERSGEKIYYSLPEAFFLVKTKKMEILQKEKKLAEKQIINQFEKIDKKFKIKYIVFEDLRKKGFILKTALKFGADFRVYEKNASIGEDHARWVLYPVYEQEALTWHDFSAKNRVAHSTKKNLLIAVVDDENDVSYYEIKWIKP